MYAVYYIYGDGDSYPIFDLIGVAQNEELARILILSSGSHQEMSLIHENMTEENNYTLVETRANARINCKNFVSYSHFGGYLISKLVENENGIFIEKD